MREGHCCQYATCHETRDARCGGCCYDLGYCQSDELRSPCSFCEGARQVQVTSLLVPIIREIPCPRCMAGAA